MFAGRLKELKEEIALHFHHISDDQLFELIELLIIEMSDREHNNHHFNINDHHWILAFVHEDLQCPFCKE